MSFSIDVAKLARPLSLLYRAWYASFQATAFNFSRVQDLMDSDRRFVAALWHNELFPLPGFGLRNNVPCVTIVSQHRDAELLAQLLEALSFKAARGSSTRGGVRALMGAVRIMKKEGRNVIITVDGPRGPRHVAKEGAVFVAAKAGVPIVPVRIDIRSKYVFAKAWDRFNLPLPFSAVRFHFGDPYTLPSEKLTEEFVERERKRLQDKLDTLGADFPDQPA